MTLKELKDWVNKLPEEFMEFTVVNGEEGKLDDQYWYRLDKPIVTMLVNEEDKEVVFLNDLEHPFTEEDIEDIKGNGDEKN